MLRNRLSRITIATPISITSTAITLIHQRTDAANAKPSIIAPMSAIELTMLSP